MLANVSRCAEAESTKVIVDGLELLSELTAAVLFVRGGCQTKLSSWDWNLPQSNT
jgi:hypothetical protein